ncbi:MAG: recombinase family protein [Clostridia bacterium]|nr:recombinase family protein [Clostridia bacterium]
MNVNAVMAKKERVVILCRSEKKDSSEIWAQERFLNEYAKCNDKIIVRIYREYGKAEMQFNTTLWDLRRMAMYKEFDVLIMPCLATFGGTPIEATSEIRFLNENGVKVVSLQEGELNFDTLPLIYRKMFCLVK